MRLFRKYFQIIAIECNCMLAVFTKFAYLEIKLSGLKIYSSKKKSLKIQNENKILKKQN